MPPSIPPAGAQGGTSARSSGAALSFVSCIRLLGVLLALRLIGFNGRPRHRFRRALNVQELELVPDIVFGAVL